MLTMMTLSGWLREQTLLTMIKVSGLWNKPVINDYIKLLKEQTL